MTRFREAVRVHAVMHAAFAGFTAMVGAFADGGDVWQRLLLVLLHPGFVETDTENAQVLTPTGTTS